MHICRLFTKGPHTLHVHDTGHVADALRCRRNGWNVTSGACLAPNVPATGGDGNKLVWKE